MYPEFVLSECMSMSAKLAALLPLLAAVGLSTTCLAAGTKEAGQANYCCNFGHATVPNILTSQNITGSRLGYHSCGNRQER